MKHILLFITFSFCDTKNFINPSIAGKQISKEGKREEGGGKERERGKRERRDKWGWFTNTQQVPIFSTDLTASDQQGNMSPTTVGTAAAAAPPAPSAQLCSLLEWERGGMRVPSPDTPSPLKLNKKTLRRNETQRSQGQPFLPRF